MKIRKRLSLVVDVLVDEGFDCFGLCLCQDVGDPSAPGNIYVGSSDDFEVAEYVSFDEVELEDDE